MSPLKLELLLRAYSMPRPNLHLPAAEAQSPAMVAALIDFRDRGIFHWDVALSTLRYGREGGADLLTPKGKYLVQRILTVAAECYKEAE